MTYGDYKILCRKSFLFPVCPGNGRQDATSIKINHLITVRCLCDIYMFKLYNLVVVIKVISLYNLLKSCLYYQWGLKCDSFHPKVTV